jgi:acetyltransferase-like isoleucine patch superfamily enzyme/dTDP-4-dehydrorhamnose 3,5-epimerase-like enzyme
LKTHPTSIIGTSVKLSQGVVIGPNCFLDGDIDIGARTCLVGAVTLVGNAQIGVDCLIEPGVCLTRAWNASGAVTARLLIGDGVWIGAGSVIANSTQIGAGARIMAGTLVDRRVPPYAIVEGNPASIAGYVDAARGSPERAAEAGSGGGSQNAAPCSVAGVSLYHFQRIRDLRGDLCIGEFERNAPFKPERYFLVFDVPSAETRGEHAHKICKQFLICVHGSVSIVVDDGRRREEFVLDRPNLGLYVPPMIWGVQYKYTRDAVLLVFASHYYDPNDYIRDYTEFLAAKGVE